MIDLAARWTRGGELRGLDLAVSDPIHVLFRRRGEERPRLAARSLQYEHAAPPARRRRAGQLLRWQTTRPIKISSLFVREQR